VRFTSPAERTLWISAALVAAVILGSILPAATVAAALRARGLLGPLTATFVIAAGVLVALFAARSRPRWRAWSVLLAAAATTAVLVSLLENLSERVHVVEYSALALLVEGALRERRGTESALEPRAWALAALATTACGLIDEGLQGLVPERVLDPLDVVLDTGSGLLALSFGVAYRAALARR
jgi:VanZ family protein